MKAQLWSLDFVLSAVVFSLALITVLFIWNYTNTETAERIEFKRAEGLVLSISDVLIRTSGVPDDWNTTTVKVLGLASDENVLNRTKVERFLSLDYNGSKRILGVPLYDYYFRLADINGGTIFINQTEAVKGVYPADAEIVVPVQRYGLLDGEIVKMGFILWD
jgi:hypothetical protein